jgi:hypothetical protein
MMIILLYWFRVKILQARAQPHVYTYTQLYAYISNILLLYLYSIRIRTTFNFRNNEYNFESTGVKCTFTSIMYVMDLRLTQCSQLNIKNNFYIERKSPYGQAAIAILQFNPKILPSSKHEHLYQHKAMYSVYSRLEKCTARVYCIIIINCRLFMLTWKMFIYDPHSCHASWSMV